MSETNISDFMAPRKVYEHTDYAPVINEIKPVFEYAYLAGGGVLNLSHGLQTNDLDFYLKESSTIEEFKKKFINFCHYLIMECSVHRIIKTDNALSFEILIDEVKYEIQLILINDNIKDILDSFDINACKCYYNGEKFYFTSECLKEVISKKITLNFSRNNCVYEYRLKKYHNKGFDIVCSQRLDFSRELNHNKGIGYLLSERDVLYDKYNRRNKTSFYNLANYETEFVVYLFNPESVFDKSWFNLTSMYLKRKSISFMDSDQINDWFAGLNDWL